MGELGEQIVRRIAHGSNDPTILSRATTFLWFSGLMFALAIAWGIAHLAWGNVAIPIVALGAASLGIAAWGIVLRGGQLRTACHVVLGAVWLPCVLGAFLAGGLRLTNACPFFMVMIAAVLLLGRGGIGWAVGTLLVAVAFQVAHWVGFEFPDHVPLAARSEDAAFTWMTTAGVTLLLVLSYERSRQNVMARLHRANLAKSVFLAHVSHEVKNAIHAVGLAHQSLLAGELARAQRERVRVAQENIAALHSFLADLLDLSAMEQGRFELHPADFSPAEVIESIGRLGATLCQAKQVQFEVQLDATVPARVHGDRWRLRQILHNLVSNAVTHTSVGRIEVSAAGTDDGPARAPLGLAVTVQDSGDGVPPDHQERIFEDFVRGPTRQAHSGSGLGLTICRELVAAMGGRLELTSTPGHGTTVTATVYFERAEGHAEADSSTAPEAAAAPKRLLVAEDFAPNLEMATLVLEDLGHEVVTARDGHEAVAAATGEPFDLILMDVQMPGCDGVEATRRIREAERSSPGSPTPIVAMTGHAVHEACQQWLDAGFDDCIFKPFTAEQLGEVVARHTGGSGEATEAAN